MKGRMAFLVAGLSLLAAGALVAQQPPAKSQEKKPAPAAAATTQPAAQQGQAAPQAQAKPAAAPAAKWTEEQIKAAQEGLKRAKVYNGPVNGKLGPETRRAIRAFQRQHKMKVNGELSDSLLNMLKAIP